MRRYTRTERRLAAGCEVPTPWNLEAFVAALTDRRGRPILLVPRPAVNDDITGTVMALPNEDIVFYRDDLSEGHREHVICHELGHLLAGHLDDSSDVFKGGGLEGAAQIMLNRSCDLGDHRELEAEHIAELLVARIQRAMQGRDLRGFGTALA